MPRYALLLYPATNRVYAASAPRLGRRELEVFAEIALGGRVSGVDHAVIGGVPYLTFSAETALGSADLAQLANLSCRYALFELADRDDPALRPVTLHPRDRFGSDLLTVQKYQGKTNEQFTKLLVNLTVLACDDPGALATGRPRLLDPMCGRGTTLNQALMYGWDAWGVETNKRDVDEYAKFLKTWLRGNRLKHTADLAPVRRNKQVLGRRFEATLAASKDEYKAGETVTVGCVHADTTRAGEFFRRGSFDVVVTDAPYGVQHGSTSGGAASRNPLALLAEALPVWAGLLRPGGAVGISWNTHVAPRADMVALLSECGFAVADSAAHRDLAHRVDAAITRDLVVARRSDPRG